MLYGVFLQHLALDCIPSISLLFPSTSGDNSEENESDFLSPNSLIPLYTSYTDLKLLLNTLSSGCFFSLPPVILKQCLIYFMYKFVSQITKKNIFKAVAGLGISFCASIFWSVVFNVELQFCRSLVTVLAVCLVGLLYTYLYVYFVLKCVFYFF